MARAHLNGMLQRAILTMVTDEDVRDALHVFHDEETFAKCRLGRYVNRLYPSASPRAGFVAIVESAFQEFAAAQPMRRLRDIIFACDLERVVSREVAAKQIGIGLRTLFRKRTEAIRVIAAHFNALISASQSDLPLPMVRGLINADAQPAEAARSKAGDVFAGVRLAFESSRMRGDILGMQTAVAGLNGSRRLLDARAAAELAIMQADLDLCHGRVAAAASRLAPILDALLSLQSSRLTRRAILARARLSFLSGNLSDAENMAQMVGQGHVLDEVSSSAAALRGRIALLTGRNWERPAAPPSRAYDRLELQAVESRHLLCSGEYSEAFETSREAHEESLRCGFLPVAAYSAATLAAASRAAHLTTSDHWAGLALQLLAASGGNAQIAKDLFQFPIGSAHAVRWFDGASCSDLAAIYLTLHSASALDGTQALADSLPLLLRTILMRAYNDEIADSLTEALTEQLWNSAGPRDRVVHAYSAELQQISAFGEFLKVLIPAGQQPAFARRFQSAASVTIRAVTRSIGYRKMRALSFVS